MPQPLLWHAAFSAAYSEDGYGFRNSERRLEEADVLQRPILDHFKEMARKS
jgi:hypothetical protein